MRCVNALNGLLLINCVAFGKTGELCQCPQRASTHFYSRMAWTAMFLTILCQCPQRASTHFYVFMSTEIDAFEDVSMPSTGFYSFLLL